MRFYTEHGIAPIAQVVKNGQAAAEPTPPEEDGWIFEGWYTSFTYHTKDESGC